jgi:hypothetical protein
MFAMEPSRQQDRVLCSPIAKAQGSNLSYQASEKQPFPDA